MKKTPSFNNNDTSKSPKLNRSVTVLGVFRIPSIRDLSEYWRGQANPRPEEPTEKRTRRKKSRKEKLDPNEESGSSSDDYEFSRPKFGRSTSEMSQTMHDKREEMRRKMAAENAALEAVKSAPASPLPAKTKKPNKVGVMFADRNSPTDESSLERPPSKKFLQESPHTSPPTTPTLSHSPPRPSSNTPPNRQLSSPLRSGNTPSPPRTITFVVPSLAPTPTPAAESPKLLTVIAKRKEEGGRGRRNSLNRSTSFLSGLPSKTIAKPVATESEEEDSNGSESDVDDNDDKGSNFIARSKSTTTFKHVAPKKKNSKSNLLFGQDAGSIHYVTALPELVWLRVAVLLAPADLVKLRSLSKKFTKYVNTNLVWASFSWRDFGNITVSSKNWREHYAQAFIRSKHPISLEIKASKQNLHINDRLFITSSVHNRSHKVVVLAVGTTDANLFETGALLRAGKGGLVTSCSGSANSSTRAHDPMFITIAPNETQSFLCRVIVTESNDCVGLMVDDGTGNFLPLSRETKDNQIWYDFKTNGGLPKNGNVREDTIYWKGTVCSNKVSLSLGVSPK